MGVRDYVDMTVYNIWALAISLNFQLDAICGVNETGAAAMHFLPGNKAKIDQKPELIVAVELLQIHMLRFVFFFHEESAYFAQNVLTFDAVVVQHVWWAVYHDADFF